jgi:hypothetical protein
MVDITGGDKLRAKLLDIQRKTLSAKQVSIGFLEGAKYPDGTSVAMVAAIQEFGAPRAGIPPRPYFRGMIKAHKAEWGPELSAALRTNGYDAAKALATMGLIIQGELKESIVELFDPPLSPVTVMLRKMKADNPDLVITGKTVGEAARRVAEGKSSSGVSTKPLIDTGTMLQSIDYEVT